MTSIEQKIFDIIRRKKNARIQYVANEAGVSSAYANLVCQGLCRRGHINFVRGLAVIPVLADISESAAAPPIPAEEKDSRITIFSIFGNLDKSKVAALENAGYKTVGTLAEAPIAKLMSIGGMNVMQAANLINKARKDLGMIK